MIEQTKPVMGVSDKGHRPAFSKKKRQPSASQSEFEDCLRKKSGDTYQEVRQHYRKGELL